MKIFRVTNIIVGNRALGHILEVKTFWGWRYWQNGNEGTIKWMKSDDKKYSVHIIELVTHLGGILISNEKP